MNPVLNAHAILHRQPNAGYYYIPDSEPSTERVNRTGEEIFDLCTGDNSPEDICQIMSKRYNEGIDTVRSLVYPFLAESAPRKTITIQNV